MIDHKQIGWIEIILFAGRLEKQLSILGFSGGPEKHFPILGFIAEIIDKTQQYFFCELRVTKPD